VISRPLDDAPIAGAARHARMLLLAPVTAFLAIFLVLPLAALFRISLTGNPGGTAYGEGPAFYASGTWTLANYARVFTDVYFLEQARFTVALAIVTAVASVVVSYALAHQIWRAPPMVKQALLMAVVLPKLTNILVLMYGFLVIFGAQGLINRTLLAAGVVSAPVPMVYNIFSVVLGELLLVVPYCVLVITAVLHGIDPALGEAAAGLGASPARVFREVTLPLSRPAISASVVLAFTWGMGAFVAPYVLGAPELSTLAVEIDRQTNWRLNWAMGAALAFVLIAMIAGPMWLVARMWYRPASVHR
jgi:ABC-type spermidine/putrescine transport system permease subunit I